MDSNQFAKHVKQKYPQYASVPDDQLTQAVVKKYPEYQSAITPTAGVGGTTTNAQPMSAPPQMTQQVQAPQQQGQQPFNGLDPSKLLGLYMKFDPAGAQKLAGQMIQQKMNVSQPKTPSPWRVVSGMISATGKPIQQNEQTGEVREADLGVVPTGRGNSKYGTPGTGVTLKSSTDPAKSHFYESRATGAEVGALSLIEKNIDPSVAPRTTPVGAAATSVRRAINGLSLLQQPVVTKTALEATMGDLDSIVTQASATVEGRRMLSTPNFRQNLTNYRSFVSGAPDKVAVPQGMVNVYKNIITDLGPIAEKFVKDRVKQQSNFYRSRGEKLVGPKEYKAMEDRILSGFSIQIPGAQSSTSDLSTLSDDELRRIAAGGK